MQVLYKSVAHSYYPNNLQTTAPPMHVYKRLYKSLQWLSLFAKNARGDYFVNYVLSKFDQYLLNNVMNEC